MTEQKKVDRAGAGAAETSHIAADPAPARRRRQTSARKQEAVLQVLRGEDVEYVPGRFVVCRILRPRMACTCCETFAQAPLPSRPVERGRPGPGLLAHVLIGKYCDHLPLDRQSKIFAREKVDLHRTTLTDRVGRSTALLEPLADHIGKLVRAGPALFADDTPVKLQTRTRIKKTRVC